MKSFWHHTLRQDFYDHIIVGAGIVGLSTAYWIKQLEPNCKVAVVERSEFANGASMRNAGFACFGSPSELLDDISQEGEDLALQRVELRWRGFQNLVATLGERAIGLERNGGYELFGHADKNLYTQCAEKIDSLNQQLSGVFGKAVFTEVDKQIQTLGFKGIEHAFRIENEASLNTAAMMSALWEKVNESGAHLIPSFSVQSLHEEEGLATIVSADGERMQGTKIILATNAYTKTLLPDIDIQPGRGQVLITSAIANLPFKGNFHMDRGYFYFRNFENRVILGGGRNLDREGETTLTEGLSETIQSRLEELLHEVILPDTEFEIERRWSGIMAFGTSKQPIVKKRTGRIIVAARSGGMGVAIGHELGKKAADLALDRIT